MAPPQSLLSTSFIFSHSPSFFPPLPNLPNPHFFPLRNPKPRKPTLIFFCCSSNAADSQTQQQRPASEGAGPAAPTRGDLFLQRHQSMEAVKNKTTTSKVKKKKKIKLSSSVASCYGCGAPLQTTELDAPGYVHLDTYELKKKHRQLRTILCGRCKLLSHGHMITAVGGNGGYSGGKQFVSAEELREKLSHLRDEKALIVKLVDIVDFNGSFLARIRDLTGSNPIILVITKVDLLPKGTDLNCVGDWVVEATTKKKLKQLYKLMQALMKPFKGHSKASLCSHDGVSRDALHHCKIKELIENLNASFKPNYVLSVHLTSSKSLVGIAGVASEIQKEKKGRDVYILGSANVGKSAFINALLKMMANKDPVAAAAQRYKPMQSAVPGTTLGPIQIDAFHGGAKLFDTPGVHLHHRQAAVIHSEDLPLLAPQNRLRGQSFPVTSDKKMLSEVESPGLNGISIFWGGLVRVDILKVLPQTRLTFYGPRAVPIHTVPTVEADEFYKKELGILLTPPTGEKRSEGWSGLQTVRQLQIKFEDQKRPACDIAISGLGWIGIEHATKQLEISDSKDSEEASRELHLAVHVPKPVEVFMRPAMPVGNAGKEWYEYRELTDKEEELRPKWYF